ncbi:uncharacterized protein [Rutidosis leptorrhynchoides]|uniref:uncharacterized protein n=1 Tax=Rutidosis leptorrhynchoides TaxID=125765 RepID=UPI003A99BD41
MSQFIKMQAKIQQSESSPSFNCYSSDTSTTSTSIAKAIHEDEDFEFSSIDSQSWTVFPVFNRDLIINDENDVSVSIISPLRNLFIEDREGSEESPSYTSSETDELETVASGTFCVRRPKCKKSNSTGSSSGSKKWTIRYLLRRSNSDGKKQPVSLSHVEKQNPINRRLKAQTPVHELFYVQRRAENEAGKRKSYLPYRRDLVGLFGNVNGIGKLIPF